MDQSDDGQDSIQILSWNSKRNREKALYQSSTSTLFSPELWLLIFWDLSTFGYGFTLQFEYMGMDLSQASHQGWCFSCLRYFLGPSSRQTNLRMALLVLLCFPANLKDFNSTFNTCTVGEVWVVRKGGPEDSCSKSNLGALPVCYTNKLPSPHIFKKTLVFLPTAKPNEFFSR